MKISACWLWQILAVKRAQIRLDGSVKKVLLSNTNDAEKSTVSVGASELKLESCEVLVVLVK